MKNLTAKQLLREVQSMQKQASSSICEPDPIEYEKGDDIERQVENSINDIFYGWGNSGVSSMTISDGIAYVEGTYSCEVRVKDVTPWWKKEDAWEIADNWVSAASNGFLTLQYGFEGLSDPMWFGSWVSWGSSNPDEWVFLLEPLETRLTSSEYKDVQKRIPFVKYYESLKWHSDSGNSFGYNPKLTGDLKKDEKIIKSLTKEFVKDLKKLHRMFEALSDEDQKLLNGG
jgi:hypothetical protein